MKLIEILKNIISEADEDLKKIKYKIVFNEDGYETDPVAYFSDKDMAETVLARYDNSYRNVYLFQKKGNNWEPLNDNS